MAGIQYILPGAIGLYPSRALTYNEHPGRPWASATHRAFLICVRWSGDDERDVDVDVCPGPGVDVNT